MTEAIESKLSHNTEDSHERWLSCIYLENGNCIHLAELLSIMDRYNNRKIITKSYATANSQSILNTFFHVLHKHNDDQQFECIFNSLHSCDIKTCDFFKRNYRNKQARQNGHIYDKNMMVYCQILDKIHCYYQHCFDIGNKLSSKEKQSIHFDSQEQLVNECFEFINRQLHKIKNILRAKQNNFKSTNRTQTD
eukprot:166776_1